MYDISDDDLPEAFKEGMKAKGWVWDGSAQEWRHHNEQGPFSPHRADHVRAWEADGAAVAAELSREVLVVDDQGGDQMRSPQVENNDTTQGALGGATQGGGSTTLTFIGETGKVVIGAGGTGEAADLKGAGTAEYKTD